MRSPALAPALGAIVCAGCARPAASSDEADVRDVAGLGARTAQANSALVRGDIDTYIALADHASDYTLMAPFGGTPTRGFDPSPGHRASMARLFRSGTFRREVLAAHASKDLVVLVTVERMRAQVASLPEQDWSLRVTQVFRRAGSRWQLVRRHADPLADGIGLERAAALARGDRSRPFGDRQKRTR